MKLFIASCFLLTSVRFFAAELIDRPTEGRQFETLNFHFEENLNFENPFDLESNKVELLIIQPDFTRLTLSFFYNGLNKNNVEKWEARFTPKLSGKHQFKLIINEIVNEQFEIDIESNDEEKQGGLVLSGKNEIFNYESGEAFRGIGINVCWAEDFEYYFKKMQANGMDITRIWLCPWNLSFEWEETGLGKYNLESAERLDSILILAEKYKIFILLCIDYHGIAPKGMGFFKENRWLDNPYNKINGGPCEDAEDLFTSNKAKIYLKRKYKYIVSRYGFSPYIAAWEFFNEADLMAGKSIPINTWHIEMAEYVKSVDVHKRLVSTSGTRNYPEKLVDAFKSPTMDFVMYHSYNDLNIAPFFLDFHEISVDYYQKPVVMAEFGIDFRGAERTYKYDPQAVGLHNGMWAGLFSETPILPLSWWWDNYIDPYNFWYEFKYLFDFAERIDNDTENLSFKNLITGFLLSDSTSQAECLVRSIYFDDNAALWFKNDDYQWSIVSEGIEPKETGSFIQQIPDLVPGEYIVKWYDPQTGRFSENESLEGLKVTDDGILYLTIPSIKKDLACLIIREE